MPHSPQYIKQSTTFAIVASIIVFVLIMLALPYQLTSITKQNASALYASYFVDSNFQFEVNDILTLPENSWQAAESYKFGLSDKPHWLRLNIEEEIDDKGRLLVINYGLLDKVDVWFLSSQENTDKITVSLESESFEVIGAHRVGESLPFDYHITKSEKFVFRIPQVKQDLDVYIRVQSKGPINVPTAVWSQNGYTEYANLESMFVGLFFGFLLAMALSSLFLFASTHNKIFVVYAAHVCCLGLGVASLHGIGFNYLWPNNVWLQELAVPIFACATLILVLTLTIKLLKLKMRSPNTYLVLRNIRLVISILFVSCFILPYEVLIKAVLVILIVSTPIIWGAGISLAIKGSLLAKYLCGAWIVLLTSVMFIAVENLGLYEPVIDSSYLLIIGAITESLLLGLALALNFSEQLHKAKRALDIAVKSELQALKTKDELIALQEESRTNLEYSIEERTLELEIAMRELSEKNQELEKLSSIDPLTELMNRRFFDKRVLAEARRSRREKTSLGLAILDIDYFKKINDQYGHLCGDHCLKTFANVLTETLKRPSDTVCRYGGEEFVLILPNTPPEGLNILLEKIRQAVENKKIVFEKHEFSMTVSIGGCSRIIASEDEHELIIAYSDKLLYQAKESGRNKVITQSY